MIVLLLLVYFCTEQVVLTHTVTCETEFASLNHSVSEINCPANCLRHQTSALCGSAIYSSGPICLAAIQEQLIDVSGGLVKVYKTSGKSSVSSTFRNGVKSQSCKSTSPSAYTFAMTCSTTGDTQYVITDVFCPPGCKGQTYSCGTDAFHLNSSICAAAIKQGKMAESGGDLKMYKYTNGNNIFIPATSGNTCNAQSWFTFSDVNACSVGIPCVNGGTCVDLLGDFACVCPAGYTGKRCAECASCALIPHESLPPDVVVTGCDFLNPQFSEESYDIGWKVFQNRYDGSVSFNRDWVDYKNGFGDISTEFWMGLDKLHNITHSSISCRLRIDLCDFSNNHAYAEYNTFSIANENEFYRISFSGYVGNAGDSMGMPSNNQNGMKFSTRGQDNDFFPSANCAAGSGAWWHRKCGYARLNGIWSNTSYSSGTLSWHLWKNLWGGIRTSRMKVKCN